MSFTFKSPPGFTPAEKALISIMDHLFMGLAGRIGLRPNASNLRNRCHSELNVLLARLLVQDDNIQCIQDLSYLHWTVSPINIQYIIILGL